MMPGDLARVNPSESVRPASPASDFGMHLYFLQLLDWPIVGTVASGVVAGMMQFRSCGCFYALGRVVDRTAMTTYARFSGDAACHFSLGRNFWWTHARRFLTSGGCAAPVCLHRFLDGLPASFVTLGRNPPMAARSEEGPLRRYEAAALGVPLRQANHRRPLGTVQRDVFRGFSRVVETPALARRPAYRFRLPRPRFPDHACRVPPFESPSIGRLLLS